MTPFPSLNSSLQGFRIHSNPLSWYLAVFIQPRCHVKGKRRCYKRRLKRVYVQCDSVFDLVRFSDAQFWKQLFDLFHTACYFRSLMTISFNSNLFCLISIVMLTYNHVILTLIVFSFDLPLCIFRPLSYVFALSGPLVVTLKQWQKPLYHRHFKRSTPASIMYRSNRRFNMPPRATPRVFDFFENYRSNSPLPGPKCRSNAPH